MDENHFTASFSWDMIDSTDQLLVMELHSHVVSRISSSELWLFSGVVFFSSHFGCNPGSWSVFLHSNCFDRVSPWRCLFRSLSIVPCGYERCMFFLIRTYIDGSRRCFTKFRIMSQWKWLIETSYLICGLFHRPCSVVVQLREWRQRRTTRRRRAL